MPGPSVAGRVSTSQPVWSGLCANKLGREALLQYAQDLGLSMDVFRTCVDSDQHVAEIRRDMADAQSARISGTPTFVIARSAPERLEGIRITGARPYQTFDATIKELLATK